MLHEKRWVINWINGSEEKSVGVWVKGNDKKGGHSGLEKCTKNLSLR